MSFFSGGAVWADGGGMFNMTSPVSDILDKDEFTLQELLEEDELLQEVKAMNNKLIDYLASESTVAELVSYLAEPAPADATDMRIHKYPYMSCEVLCCDISDILDALVEASDGQYLAKLFSLLQLEGPLDCRLAGYFEKVVGLLLQRKTLNVVNFINQQGIDLFKLFARHLDSYSIMELVKRILQPAFGAEMFCDGLLGMHSDEVPPSFPTVQWHEQGEVVTVLLDIFEPGVESDIQNNVAEVLIHIIVNATSAQEESALMTTLMAENCSKKLVAAALPPLGESKLPSRSIISPVYVLATLLSCNYMHDNYEQEQQGEGGSRAPPLIEEVLAHMHNVTAYLEAEQPRMHTQCSRADTVPSLGVCRLKAVELAVILVRTKWLAIDQQMVKQGLLVACVRLFFDFEWNNMLHSLVEAIIINIVESGSEEVQRNLLTEGKLIDLMLEAYENDKEQREAGKKIRSGYIGHLNRISNLLVASLDYDESGAAGDDKEDEGNHGSHGASRFATLMRETEQWERWEVFMNSTLAEINIMESCPLGGASAPSHDQGLSDDELDFGAFATVGGQDMRGFGNQDDDDDFESGGFDGQFDDEMRLDHDGDGSSSDEDEHPGRGDGEDDFDFDPRAGADGGGGGSNQDGDGDGEWANFSGFDNAASGGADGSVSDDFANFGDVNAVTEGLDQMSMEDGGATASDAFGSSANSGSSGFEAFADFGDASSSTSSPADPPTSPNPNPPAPAEPSTEPATAGSDMGTETGAEVEGAFEAAQVAEEQSSAD